MGIEMNGYRLDKTLEQHILIRRNDVFAKKRQNADWFSGCRKKAIPCKRNQTELFGPIVIVDAWIVGHIVGDKLGIHSGGNTSDLIAAKRYSPVHLTINVGITP